MGSDPLDPGVVAQRLREENERRDREQRRKEIADAERRGQEKQLIENRLKGHEEKLVALQELIPRVREVEKRMSGIEKSFGEFTAVARALAENGISNRTFMIGVGMLLVAIIGLFIGVAKP